MKAAFTPGSTFAGYRVEALVGRGGMGVVYRATDLSLERPVALKLIAPELAGDERFRSRFLREPRLAASLDHPNVIPIYEAGEHDGQLYLAMRFVEGSDLRTLLDGEGKLSPERTLEILAQVAGALDSAHRRALVHRDVKPGNVLLDRDGHVYLTDFGITQQLGGASTDTGRMAGTLDYLAPEQIRGDPVDARTDGYALGCVLYECLAGRPPFHRETEAETMWAHMQEEPPTLRGLGRLDPVLRKALAKDREDRYASSAELIDAAAAALGLRAPAPGRRPLVSRALHRRARAILAGGGVLLAAAVALAILASTGGDDPAEELGNGVAAIDTSGEVSSFIQSEAAPGNVAVGDGAVWVLDNEGQTVSRIDPETKRFTKTFKTRGVPSELAVGEGALWIGYAGGDTDTNAMVRVSRLDPESGRITETVRLRGDEGAYFPVAGAPRIAVGAGAVWAAAPDGNVVRIDPDSGRLEATVDTSEGEDAWTVAAGKEGVWYIDGDAAVARIDPRTNRVTQRIPVGANSLLGVAVGGGSVWAAANEEGVIWRIDPSRTFRGTPVTRTIDVGIGVTFVAFGEGSVWTGNYVDGTVARIDPATNMVEARTSVSAPQALAAGAGSAWVSVAAGTTEGALTVSGCGAVASGGRTPDVLIASDLPLQGPFSANPRALEGAIRFILERHRFRAGKYSVGYQSCDVSTAQTGGFEFRKCAANASAFAHAKQLVAVIGPWSSFCGQVGIPILNRAPGGPLVTVSPISTHPGLTRGGRLGDDNIGSREGEPQVYYPTGVRNFARLMAREDVQGVANAMLAKELGLKRVYVLYDPKFNAEQRDPFLRAAPRLGVRIAGSDRFRETTKNGDAIAERVARSGADGVYISGLGSEGGGNVLKSLRPRLGTRVKIMAADPFVEIRSLLEFVGPAARDLYVSATDVPASADDLSSAGRQFARDHGARGTTQQGLLPAAQAAELVLDAIARSDGTRASVLEEIRGAEVKDGILGDFRLDRYGDITPAPVSIFRVTGRTPPGEPVFEQFNGAVLDRVISVPASLSG